MDTEKILETQGATGPEDILQLFLFHVFLLIVYNNLYSETTA